MFLILEMKLGVTISKNKKENDDDTKIFTILNWLYLPYSVSMQFMWGQWARHDIFYCFEAFFNIFELYKW